MDVDKETRGEALKGKRVSKFEDIPAYEFLLLRQKLGFGKYRKTRERDEEKTAVLRRLALKRMEEAEKDDYIEIGPRRRRLKIK